MWKPEILWLHVISDAIITISYYSIPFALIVLVRKRQDLAFEKLFLLFGGFILLCGTTHLLGIWAVWDGIYRLTGIVKLITALFSLGTAIVLWPTIPRILRIPSHQQLYREIEQRKEVEIQLREQEKNLKAAQEIAQLGSWEWDAKTDALSLSDKMQEILGVNDDGGKRGFKTITESIHPADSGAIWTALEVNTEKHPRLPFEYRIIRPDKSVRYVWADIHHILDQDCGLVRIVGVAQDVTERKQLENQLMHAQKMESVGQLAAGVAHEINTPMQYVGNNTQFLKDSVQDVFEAITALQRVLEEVRDQGSAPELVEDVESLLEETDLNYLTEEIPRSIEESLEGITRVSRLVKAMKEFSHPGHEEKTLVDINHALETTVTVARNEWKYVADIAWDLDSSLEKIPAFAADINQVFLNIIVNAAHAIEAVLEKSEQEKGLITIQTRAEKEAVVIRIQDTGSGIPKHIQTRIFDHFFTTKEVGKGTGQGLSIAYSVVVDKHGGHIGVESEEGQGTTFSIRLPCAVDSYVPEKSTGSL